MICLNLNITRFLIYSKTTERQILPVILAGHRQILPIQALECTYLLGLQAGMETAIYRVSPNHPKGANDMKHLTSPVLLWIILVLWMFSDAISLLITTYLLG